MVWFQIETKEAHKRYGTFSYFVESVKGFYRLEKHGHTLEILANTGLFKVFGMDTHQTMIRVEDVETVLFDQWISTDVVENNKMILVPMEDAKCQIVFKELFKS